MKPIFLGFKMNEEKESNVVINRVDEIQVYPNSDGGITIKQVNAYGDDDSLVWFDICHAELIIKAIRSAKKEIKGA